MQRRALIIGISDYNNLQQLSFCKNDGNSMYKTLCWGGYIIPNDRKLIGRINWAEMRKAIIDFFVDSSISPEDILIFYYSGHAIPDIDGDV
jgi:Caspase domain